MGSLGPTHLIALLLAVAIIAAMGGFIASAVTRRTSDAHAGSSFWASSVDGWRARYCAAGVATLTGSEHSPGASTSAHREPGYVMTLVDSLLARSLLRHHMFDRWRVRDTESARF